MARRIRLYALVEGLAIVAVVAGACFAVQFALDRTLRLRVDLRAALLASVVAVLLVAAWRKLLGPLRARVQVDDVASSLERRFPQIQTRLISAVQFTRPPGLDPQCHSPALIRRVVEEAASEARAWPLEQMLNHRRARGFTAMFCALLALAAALAVWAPTALGIWFERNVLLSSKNWPQETDLLLLNDPDGDGVIYTPIGDDLPLRVAWRRRQPESVLVRVDVAGGRAEEHDMTAVGQDEFRHTLVQVTEPLSLRIRGGDARLGPVRVELVERPRVGQARITVHPPAYTGREFYPLRAGQNLVEVLAGAAVDLEIVPAGTSPVVRAELFQDQTAVALAEASGDGFRIRIEPRADANYWFELTDERGLRDLNPRQFMVRMKADAPPTAALEIADAGPLITPQAVLSAAMTFADEYGLDAARLVHRREGQEENVIDLDLSPGTSRLTATHTLNLPDLQAEEGQRLILRCEGQDLNDVTGPGVGKSSEFIYRIVSSEELLADLARREQEYYQDFARLIEAQEQLRDSLLSVARAVQTEGPASPRLADAAGLPRRERQLGRQVAHVRGQFQSIYAELVVNRLDSAEVQERLVGGIVVPLETLAARQIPEVADAMETLMASADLARFRQVDLQIAGLLEEMNRILENMTRWEGFHESVRLLQTIVNLQRDLQKETRQTHETRFEELFGDQKKDDKDKKDEKNDKNQKKQ
jgi:hypothetical protein